MNVTYPPLAGPLEAHTSRQGKKIVVATWGSLGDLYPYLAIGRELLARGHRPVIATNEGHRARIEAEGIGFHRVRPDLPGPETPEGRELVCRAMDIRDGTKVVIGEMMMPHLREAYEDLKAAAQDADLLVSHPLTYTGPMVAEELGLPWAGTMLQPMMFFSAYDPPIPPAAPSILLQLFRLGPRFNRVLLDMGKRQVQHLVEPVKRLRAELGLTPCDDPMFKGQMSPYLNLALFSSALGAPQPDWPPHTLVTGFPFYEEKGAAMPPALAAFLQAGPSPVVFTLGSSAVMIGGDFYVESTEAARQLGRRAVLLVGKEGWNRLPDPLPEGVIALEYAPHGELFARAAAVVHQGGAGTTGQALRSGHPMLVVPFAHDQPDHAARITRLGVGLSLSREAYTAPRVAKKLRRLLEEPQFQQRAAEVGRHVRAEDGVGAACGALDGCLAARR